MARSRHPRYGNWLPADRTLTRQWMHGLRERATAAPQPLVGPIATFEAMVKGDPVLFGAMETMFASAYARAQTEPTGAAEVQTFDDFLRLLNAVMTTAPEYIECPDAHGTEAPCGLIGFPINALLDWPMATDAGYDVFANSLINQQLKRILTFWSQFLTTEASRYVLVNGRPSSTPIVLPWLSATARQEMVTVACQSSPTDAVCRHLPFEHFFDCDPSDPYYGYTSWDDFFTRRFVEGVRPVAAPDDDDVIANACESAPYRIARDVSATAPFWLKDQPYSLFNMLAWDPRAPQFEGGTVYQAFLSALSFHRWHSPVAGTIRQATVVDGSYYLENQHEGFDNPFGADTSAPNDSQGFLTSVATRAVIFIEADNPAIGLMAFVAVGMAEVSSCEITVAPGQHVAKGEELGMFHFGGSTHCLVFRPETALTFDLHQNAEPGLEATNIAVNARIATVGAEPLPRPASGPRSQAPPAL